ncbi:MAG: zinc-binding dehydrogenase [Treponema sp.]|jgi:threonine dehydrogenase-like Zn-dependent dehydrogenase|nr:zinc-binding dehydrogenase [Treponema sp.]
MKPKTFKAAIYRGIGKVDVADLPYPECGDDDVIVKNLYAGCCGADVNAYSKGGDPHMIWKDHEFGHEMVSEVVEVGKNVKNVNVGDIMFPNQGNALRDRNRMATVGAFSEYIRIIKYEPNFSAIPIDKDIPLKWAVLFEPFVIGTRGALNLKPGPGKTAIVFGAGVIGLTAAIMLKWYGCDKVMSVDLSDYRLENAKKFGLLTCNSSKEDLKAKAIAEFGSMMCFGGEACAANLFVDAIGIQPIIDQFQAIGGRGATLGVVGVHHHPATIEMMRLTYNTWNITGCGISSIFDLAPDILNMMKSGKYDLEALISHEYPIDKINEALVMGGKANEAQKVIISFM